MSDADRLDVAAIRACADATPGPCDEVTRLRAENAELHVRASELSTEIDQRMEDHAKERCEWLEHRDVIEAENAELRRQLSENSARLFRARREAGDQ